MPTDTTETAVFLTDADLAVRWKCCGKTIERRRAGDPNFPAFLRLGGPYSRKLTLVTAVLLYEQQHMAVAAPSHHRPGHFRPGSNQHNKEESVAE